MFLINWLKDNILLLDLLFIVYFVLVQTGSLFYFFVEDWKFVNEFRHVVGKYAVFRERTLVSRCNFIYVLYIQ